MITSPKKVDVLFLGGFYPTQLLSTVREDSFGKIGFSNHNFEQSIIGGLLQQDNLNLRILSAPLVYSYPYNNKKLYTPSESYAYKYTHIKSIGFCNLAVVNKIWMTVSLIFNLLHEFKRFRNRELKVIVNTPNFYYVLALRVAQIFSRKRIEKLLVVPDIPSFVTSMDRCNPIKSFLLKILNSLSMKMASSFDHHVLLSDAMASLFNTKLDYLVMEGLIDLDKIKSSSLTIPIRRKNVILYTGTLRKIFGVMNLVEAFDNSIFDDAELWICGSGEASKEIEKRAISNPRIHFYGLVDSEKALKMQSQATVLVNPRTSEGEFTKYSFPSKTIEYLLSGAVVVINRLPGIPKEYYDYVVTPQNESVEALRTTLRNVLDLTQDERDSLGKRGKKYIQESKNSKIQVERLLKMFSK